MSAIQKDFDNGRNDMREFALESEDFEATLNEATDLKGVSDIVKREERWSDRDFNIETLKDGVIRVAPKHSMILRRSLDVLKAHFDIKSSSDSLDDERRDFWEYFLKPKGVKSKGWDGLDEATNESSTWEKLSAKSEKMFGKLAIDSLTEEDMAKIINLKEADKLANKRFGEFGFATLNPAEMKELINKYPNLVK
jgi:hypothetical protein